MATKNWARLRTGGVAGAGAAASATPATASVALPDATVSSVVAEALFRSAMFKAVRVFHKPPVRRTEVRAGGDVVGVLGVASACCVSVFGREKRTA
jgi:hypothetical protein